MGLGGVGCNSIEAGVPRVLLMSGLGCYHGHWEQDNLATGAVFETIRRGLQSKRPQVKTSPSQNVPELVKTSPKIGQNVPMV